LNSLARCVASAQSLLKLLILLHLCASGTLLLK